MEKEKKAADKKTKKEKDLVKKEPAKKEGVSEIFEIEKDGKEKEIIAQANVTEPEKAPSDSQLKKEKKTLITIMVVLGGLVLMFLFVYWFSNYAKTFTYEGVNFYVDKTDMKGVTLYKTSLPVTYNGSAATYNFYLRTDPRTMNDVAFEGNLTITHNMVINSTNTLNCGGNGIIATANLVNLYTLLGTDVIRDDNATCDPVGQYTFVRIEEGNETKIEQFGPSCYKIEVSNCEILKATEKFMVETLSKVNSVLKGQ
jgi:hypothetical protein